LVRVQLPLPFESLRRYYSDVFLYLNLNKKEKCDELDHVLKTNKINNVNDEALMIGDTKYDVIGVKNFN
jgi:phosphoglycolate phosphatase-like HAD superfamily hydrolase